MRIKQNEKMRITAIVAVTGLGIFAPLMMIIKHSTSSEAKPDQTKMTVIRELHKKELSPFSFWP